MILLDNTVGIIGFMSILKMASYVDIRNGVYKKKNDYILFFFSNGKLPQREPI